MALFYRNGEKRERDQREARILLRRHGPDALDLLEQRAAFARSPRHRAHWKRIKREAEQIVGDYCEAEPESPAPHVG